jgi:excisionase family DNA binding protein
MRPGALLAAILSRSERLVASRRPKKSRKPIRDLQQHPEPYVTVGELAEYWRMSRKQIYKQIEGGTLHAIKLGPRLLRISIAQAISFERIAKMSHPVRETSEKRRR